MPIRLAACEPCRHSKLACDHVQPTCTRCRDRDQDGKCVYRSRPFKKKGNRRVQVVAHEFSRHRSRSSDAAAAATEPTLDHLAIKHRSYPNPGYLGSSSHTTFFNNLQSDDGAEAHPEICVDDADVASGASFIAEVFTSPNFPSYFELADTWVAKGVNLALAGPFVTPCARAMRIHFDNFTYNTQDVMNISRNLFAQSCAPLSEDAVPTLEDYNNNLSHPNTRWETLGLFFTAVARATHDIPFHYPLYGNEQQRRRFRALTMRYSNRCLEIALSLDCLNDLQLALQYENYILHTHVDGDQSYHSWRRLGDVISTLFALGYHERVDTDGRTPAFLKDFRQTALARAYSADKNVSIFLGRPPRLHRRYCRSELLQGSFDHSFDYVAETRWSARCAVLKERILDLFQDYNYDSRVQGASLIRADAELQWLALPSCYRLEGALKDCDRRPVERDFLVSARLNHLHVIFLSYLMCQPPTGDPDDRLVCLSVDLLSLVVEAVVLKEHLANSGTSLVWKVGYYGLAAAGVLCLSLLSGISAIHKPEVRLAKVVQDLHVLVAEVETGALVPLEDPNYALFARATVTIKSLLTRILSDGIAKQPTSQPTRVSEQPVPEIDGATWNPWETHTLQDFEVDFWVNLAEHPFLTGESPITGFL